jgi:hypothetical protein
MSNPLPQNYYYFLIVGKNDNPVYEAEFMDTQKV